MAAAWGSFSTLVLALGICLPPLHGSQKSTQDPKAPALNVVFILTDQQRYDSLGSNGNPDAVTPNIDALARGGVRFESAYVAQPLCSPNRASLLTGMYPHTTGVIDNGIPLLNHSTVFLKLLHDAGYRTCYIGKWHLSPRKGIAVDPPGYIHAWKGYNTGVSHWIKPGGGYLDEGDDDPENMVRWYSETEIPSFAKGDPGTYRSDLETDWAVDFIRQSYQKPFCLFVSYYPPHTNWAAPRENCRRFQGKVKYPVYYAMVNRIDENVGRIVSTLDEFGIREKTLIVYTTDHGENFEFRWNQHPKRACYDASSKIPLIFNWKNHLPSAVRSQLISHVDVAPTILDLCNIKIPKEIQGLSARNLLEGDVKNVRDFVMIQNQPLDPWSYPRISPQKLMAYLSSDRLLMYERCIVTDDWKLILNSNPERAPELYRRKTDIDESDNRYSDPSSRDVRDRLLRTVEQYAWSFQDQLALILPR